MSIFQTLPGIQDEPGKGDILEGIYPPVAQLFSRIRISIASLMQFETQKEQQNPSTSWGGTVFRFYYTETSIYKHLFFKKNAASPQLNMYLHSTPPPLL